MAITARILQNLKNLQGAPSSDAKIVEFEYCVCLRKDFHNSYI